MNIVFVCQRGELELKSLFLAWSLKKNTTKQNKLFAAIPDYKDWGNISNVTEEVFRKLNVEVLRFQPSFGESYPIGNKIDALGMLPDESPGCFIDSDIVCLSEFNFEEHLQNGNVLAKPADMGTWGGELEWEYLYELFGLPQPVRRVRQTVTKNLSWPYFNAGLVVVKNPGRFAKEWKRIAQKVQLDDNVKQKNPWLDQITLPLTIATVAESSWVALDENFNYPAHQRTLAENEIALCHYHWPGIVLREPRLRALFDEFIKTFSEVKVQFKDLSNWSSLFNPKYPLSKSFPEKELNFLITGIPRSGTSFVSSLLHAQKNWVVINEPAEIFDYLQNRTDASGIALYHAQCREKVISGEPIVNKVENGNVIQDTAIKDERNYYSPPIVALVRNPIDTLTSWRKTFIHLKEMKPSNLPIANPQYHGWNNQQRKCLEEIDNQKDERLRRVLFWRLLAQSLLEQEKNLLLFRYEDIVEKPEVIQHKLNKMMRYPTFSNIVGSQYRNREHDYDQEDFNMLSDLCLYEIQALGYSLTR